MQILVLGATGSSGLAFCRVALREDHNLTIYARNPAKLPQEVQKHESVTVMQGDYGDEEGLKKASQCGAKVLVSFAGPVFWQTGTPITNCYRLLFPHLAAASYTHAFILSTPSHTIPEDKGGIRWFALITTIRTFANSMYTEILATADFVTKQKDVPWTLFRVPILGSGDVKEVKAGATGDGAVGMSIARASVAGWVLKALNEGEKWEGKAPLLSDV